jgi:DNA modification methylase
MKKTAPTMNLAARPVVTTFLLKDLNPAMYNPRKIGDVALAGLRTSLGEFGYVEMIVVNIRDDTNVIVGGHQRYKVLLAEGVVECDCIVVDLSVAEEKLLNVTLNNPHIQGQFVAEIDAYLADLYEAIGDEDLLLDLQINQLAADIAQAPVKPEDDAVPDPPVDPKSKAGDLYVLGDHRLLCGDSEKAEDIARLMDGETGVLMVTDPPYGVNYDPNWRNEAGVSSSAQVGLVTNDDRASWSTVFSRWPCDVMYVWHAAMHSAEVERSLCLSGFDIKAQIIWVKKRFALSRGHYHWMHEPCYYAVKKGKTSGWIGGRKQATIWADIVDNIEAFTGYYACAVDSDVAYMFSAAASTCWEIPHDKACGGGHSTQKPVECMARPIRNNSQRGQIVTDAFLGSGTTIIAAEKLGRRCFGMEISPVYCDVIVQRWENYTGLKAVLEAQA